MRSGALERVRSTVGRGAGDELPHADRTDVPQRAEPHVIAGGVHYAHDRLQILNRTLFQPLTRGPFFFSPATQVSSSVLVLPPDQLVAERAPRRTVIRRLLLGDGDADTDICVSASAADLGRERQVVCAGRELEERGLTAHVVTAVPALADLESGPRGDLRPSCRASWVVLGVGGGVDGASSLGGGDVGREALAHCHLRRDAEGKRGRGR